MDTITKTAVWLFTGLFAGIGLTQMPGEPRTVVEQPPATTVYEAYNYGEVPAGAPTSPALAPSGPVDAPKPEAPTPTTTVWKEPVLTSACHTALQKALDVGWPAKEMATLARVLWRESRCGPKAFNPKDPMGGSHGIMQVNSYWCKPVTGWPKGWLQARRIITDCDDLYNRETNLRAGLAIWLDYGWQPWGIK